MLADVGKNMNFYMVESWTNENKKSFNVIYILTLFTMHNNCVIKNA